MAFDEEDPSLPLADFAMLNADIDAGFPRHAVLEAANVEEDAFEESKLAWLGRIAREAEINRFELGTRYGTMFKARLAIAKSRVARGLASEPPPDEAPVSVEPESVAAISVAAESIAVPVVPAVPVVAPAPLPAAPPSPRIIEVPAAPPSPRIIEVPAAPPRRREPPPVTVPAPPLGTPVPPAAVTLPPTMPFTENATPARAPAPARMPAPPVAPAPSPSPPPVVPNAAPRVDRFRSPADKLKAGMTVGFHAPPTANPLPFKKGSGVAPPRQAKSEKAKAPPRDLGSTVFFDEAKPTAATPAKASDLGSTRFVSLDDDKGPALPFAKALQNASSVKRTVATPQLTLEQYASFEAEAQAPGSQFAAVSQRYGLAGPASTRERQAWAAAFAAKPPLRVQYEQLLKSYRQFLRGSS